MPKRKTTPKQRAASRRNLIKARAAKPVGKSGITTVEVNRGGFRNSRALQKSLKAEGAGQKIINSMNYHNGGWVPDRRGNGTFNLVARNSRTKKVTGIAVIDVFASPARGYGRSVSVDQVFKEKSAPKGTGTALMAASAKIARSRDLSKKAKTDFKVSGALETAKGFYKKPVRRFLLVLQLVFTQKMHEIIWLAKRFV